MLSKSFLIVCAFACLSLPALGEEHKTPTQVTEAVEKFLELVETHNLNLSVLFSNVENYWSDRVSRIEDVALLLPPNDKQLKESKLTPKVGEEWIKTVRELDMSDTYGQWRQHQVGNEIVEVPGYPNTPAYKWLVNYVDGKQQFEIDEENILKVVNFKIEKGDGKDSRATVIVANITLTVSKSKGLTDQEIDVMKTTVIDNWLRYSSYTGVGKTVEFLNEKIPDNDWQMFFGVGRLTNKSKKYVIFESDQFKDIIIFSKF